MRAHEFITEGGKRLDQDTIDLVKIYSDEGKKPAEIAKALNLKITQVASILRNYYPERKNKNSPIALALNNDDRQEIVSKFKNGVDLRQLGRSYGISNVTVTNIVKNILGQEEYNNEIKRRQAISGEHVPNKLTPEITDTIRKLYVQGKTLQDISNYLDNIIVSTSVLRAIERQPDYEELKAKRNERTRKINTGSVATTNIYRPGTTDNLRGKGPGGKHTNPVSKFRE